MDLLEQEFSLFPLVWSGPSKIRASNYCLIPTVQILTVHCEIWSDAPDSEACLIWRSKMWPLLCVFLFLILSPDFTAAAVAAVVVVRGGGAGGDAVEDDNTFFFFFFFFFLFSLFRWRTFWSRMWWRVRNFVILIRKHCCCCSRGATIASRV